jgi:hypothetical protein
VSEIDVAEPEETPTSPETDVVAILTSCTCVELPPAPPYVVAPFVNLASNSENLS